MTRKAELYQFIAARKHDFNEWVNFQAQHPWLQIKQSGHNQILINLSESSGWIDPYSWATNYRANLVMRFDQAMKDLLDVSSESELRDFKLPSGAVMLPQERVAKIERSASDNHQLAKDYSQKVRSVSEELISLYHQNQGLLESKGSRLKSEYVIARISEKLCPTLQFPESIRQLEQLFGKADE